MPLTTQLSAAGAALLLLLIGSHSSTLAAEQAPVDGQPVAGLNIRLQLPAAEQVKAPPSQFEVTIQNVGRGDLNVKLGYSLANGKSHHPAALRLLATSLGNETVTLTYRHGRSAGVAGRVDPLVVPLPVGSSYTLRCAFDSFVDAATGEPLDLAAREYRLAAELAGTAVTRHETNTGSEGLALMSFWTGKARSNELRLPQATQ